MLKIPTPSINASTGSGGSGGGTGTGGSSGPTSVQDTSGLSANNDIKVKTAYNGEIMITYIEENVTFERLCQEIRGICRFSPDQPFTMKWVDDENDPCTISTQMELDEAIRLYEINKDSELVIHGQLFL
ncbi:atypical protein kinase C-like isoform X2 [Condylostylus longicornis]|uniref:atypical protein kinase C-like isoform X2 n=1 Tax=Condylostylus longicornis TaxID=2530218 RepID=UPI00244E307D|nr:atypical protein kinase C-like isoform X2 [Condylostylus longicornis]